MLVDLATRVIVLPKGGGGSVIPLPYGDGSTRTVFWPLLEPISLYEFRAISGAGGPKSQPTVPRTGVAVKSFIFESTDGPGQVVQNPTIFCTSKFNLIYYLAHICMYWVDRFTHRFITFDDMSDTLCGVLDARASEFVRLLPRPYLLQKLSLVCEVLQENGEEFFKFLALKAMKLLNDKVNALYKVIKGNPALVASVKLRTEHQCDQEEIPANIWSLAILQYCVDTIFDGYIRHDGLKKQFIEFNSIDFAPLREHKQKQERKRKELETVEANMKAVADSSAAAKRKPLKKVVFKPMKKVAKGKGALDSFFKKA